MQTEALAIKREYIRVPAVLKQTLLNLVFRHGDKIKEAARKLDIKYATAKTIIFYYRVNHIKKAISKATLMCCYAIRDNTKIKALSQIAGGSVYNSLK